MLSWESMHSIAIGGLAPHVTELSAALARRGHEIHVFTRMGADQSRYEFVDGVHYHRCPFEPHPDFITYTDRMCDSFVWHLIETEQFLGRAFDLIHGHDWLSAHAVRRMKNDYHHPVVMTIHSTEFGRCGNSIWDDPLSRRIRDLEWESTYLADRVITVSRTLAAEVQRCYDVPSDKLFAIYNGVDVTKYNAHVDIAAVRRKYDITTHDPFVLFAGRLTWQKGPDLLLEAVPRVLDDVPDAKVVFAGEGDMRPKLEDRAAKMGLKRAIRFLGHRSGSELVSLFKSADLVCVPSRNEPFGIVILEAWSASKPVVATRIGGPAEFVRDDYTGLTVEADIVPIGNALQSVLRDKERARRMGENGRREAESRFTWDHAAIATEAVYQTLLPIASQNNGRPRQESTIMAARPSRHGNDQVLSSHAIPARENRKAESAPPSEPTTEEIRMRAHQIWLKRSQTGAPGDAVSDWLQAERELRAMRREPSPTPRPTVASRGKKKK